jgi:hypothetical protein
MVAYTRRSAQVQKLLGVPDFCSGLDLFPGPFPWRRLVKRIVRTSTASVNKLFSIAVHRCGKKCKKFWAREIAAKNLGKNFFETQSRCEKHLTITIDEDSGRLNSVPFHRTHLLLRVKFVTFLVSQSDAKGASMQRLL